jgi:hypothetical protein
MSDEYIHPMPIFAIESEPLPGAFAPSVDSLLPNGPVESMHASIASQGPEQAFFASQTPDPTYYASQAPEEPPTFRPSATPDAYVVGGSLLSPARASIAATPTIRPATIEDDDAFHIPINRPMRVAVVLAAIGFFSALVGSAFGIKSQDGPRAVVEQRVGRVETSVVELAGSVRALEGQASAYSSAINALDARLSRQTSGAPALQAETPKPQPLVVAPRDAESRATVRRRVRQAMRELDAVAPAKPQ